MLALRTVPQFRRVGRIRKRRTRPPKQLQPKAIEVAYAKELRAFVDVCREAVKGILLPQLPEVLRTAAQERGDAWHEDATGRRVRELMARVRRAVDDAVEDEQLERLARDMAGRTSRFQREQLDKQVRAIVGADVFAVEPNLSPLAEAFVETNVALIKSLPETTFGQVETLVMQAVRSGARHEQLAEDIQGRFDVADSRAALIARDQTLKFYGELNHVRQTALGVDAYIWRATPDNRTREEHLERDGRRYLWAEPPADGHPGAAVACRCSAEPDIAGALEGLEVAAPTPIRPTPRPRPRPQPRPTGPPPAAAAPAAPPAPAPRAGLSDINAIPVGTPLPKPVQDDAYTRFDFYSYSHVLSSALQAEGYSISFEIRTEKKAHARDETQYSGRVRDKDGREAARVSLDVLNAEGRHTLYVHLAEVTKGYGGNRFGQTLLESAIVHAKAKHGVTHVEGGIHSTSAHEMHQRVAAKYGWKYHADFSSPEAATRPQGAFDERFGPYRYRVD